MTSAIADQIRKRLDEIAKERAGLDDEERSLRVALRYMELRARPRRLGPEHVWSFKPDHESVWTANV